MRWCHQGKTAEETCPRGNQGCPNPEHQLAHPIGSQSQTTNREHRIRNSEGQFTNKNECLKTSKVSTHEAKRRYSYLLLLIYGRVASDVWYQHPIRHSIHPEAQTAAKAPV